MGHQKHSDSGKTVIKAATGANAKPYVYVGDDDKPAGYDVDVLNAVFDKLPDYELEYEVTDFGSVLSGLNSGNYQIGVNNFSYNEDRGASYLYSYPYDKISYVFVTKKGGKELSFEALPEEDPHPVARTPAASVTAKMLANFFIIFFLVFRLLFFCFKFVCRIFTE